MERSSFLILATFMGLVLLAGPAGATFEGQNGKIAFANGGNIWTIDPSGANQTKITNGAEMWGPVWSPDGTRIAFIQNGPGLGGYGNALFVVNADGTGRTKLSGALRGGIQEIRWSPDGTRVAFADDMFDAVPRVGAIIAARSDGSGQKVLAGYGSLNVNPSWSPDGSKIYFSSNRDGDGDVFVMASDGTGVKKLTLDAVNEFDPMLSPDGTSVAFAKTVKRNLSIFVMNADGTGQVRLTTSRRTSDRFPTWSPDGSWIAFWRVSTRGREQIYRMRSDGTAAVALTAPGLQLDSMPAWSPDSAWVIFDTDAGRIWTVAVTATNPTDLTAGWGPDWQAA